MRVWIVILSIVALLALLGCAQQQGPVCSSPYILKDGKCCLDKNNDGMCDVETQIKADCSLCPPQFVTQKEEVTVYKYVCANNSIMDHASDCAAAVVSNAAQFTPSTDQDPRIKDFSVRPACRGDVKAAELHLSYNDVPLNITVQVQDDPKGSFFDSFTVKPTGDMYFYLGFCSNCGLFISQQVDAHFDPSRAYMVRAVLTYPDKNAYSRDWIVDPTPAGDVGKKTCS